MNLRERFINETKIIPELTEVHAYRYEYVLWLESKLSDHEPERKAFEAGREMSLHNTLEFESFEYYLNSEKP